MTGYCLLITILSSLPWSNLVKLPEIKPSLNGKHEAPPPASGAFVVPPARTSFPSEQPPLSLPTFVYQVSRYQLGGMPLLNWVRWALFGATLIWASGWLPGRWWVAGACIALLVLSLTVQMRLRKRDFVNFQASALPTTVPRLLDPSHKIPIYATGLFSVENKYQRYTWLPGFYRTFATREHALLCQMAARKFLQVVAWPESETGLWYVFFMPGDIKQIRWGALRFGKTVRPALAVTYELTIPKQARMRKDAMCTETIFLAVQNEADGHTLLADLCFDAPAAALIQSTTSASSQR